MFRMTDEKCRSSSCYPRQEKPSELASPYPSSRLRDQPLLPPSLFRPGHGLGRPPFFVPEPPAGHHFLPAEAEKHAGPFVTLFWLPRALRMRAQRPAYLSHTSLLTEALSPDLGRAKALPGKWDFQALSPLRCMWAQGRRPLFSQLFRIIQPGSGSPFLPCALPVEEMRGRGVLSSSSRERN